jgi:hypothetical protein
VTVPLDAGSLATSLQGIGPQGTIAAAAAAWAGAVGAYAAGVFPASTAIAAATAGLQTALADAFAQEDSTDAIEAVEDAFGAFAVVVAGGMAGAGFTGAAPSGDVGFAELFDDPTDDASAAAEAVADAIHTWMQTGTATLNSPPGTVSPWA